MSTAVTVLRKNRASVLVAKVEAALNDACLTPEIDTNTGIYSIDGMSGKRYRRFINHLVRTVDDARYLEIGSWMGSTLCSAVHGNAVTAVAIDNWSEFGGPKDIFMKNVQQFATHDAKTFFIESDFRRVDYGQMKDGFNIYLFDGPHEAQDQFDGLSLPLSAIDSEFVFIVDDWNWARVRAGTLSAIRKCNLNVAFAAEVRTTLDNTQPTLIGKHSDWHNGYYISVLMKP